jgi:hypothetical protein
MYIGPILIVRTLRQLWMNFASASVALVASPTVTKDL